MIFNKKCVSMMLLMMIFGQIGAMDLKRKSDDSFSSPTKRQRLECPPAPRKQQTREPRRMQAAGKAIDDSFKKAMEAHDRQQEIEEAIKQRDFDKTINSLSKAQEIDVTNKIIGDIFDSKFTEEQDIALYEQLKKVGGDAVWCYRDAETNQTLFHIVAKKNQSDLFYRMLLECKDPKSAMQATDNFGQTVVHFASHSQIISDAFRNGANLNVQNTQGRTALHSSAGKRYNESWKAAHLLALGASSDIKDYSQRGWGIGRNAFEHGKFTFGEKGTNPGLKDSESKAKMIREGVAETMGGSMTDFLRNRQNGTEKRSFYYVPFIAPINIDSNNNDGSATSGSSTGSDSSSSSSIEED